MADQPAGSGIPIIGPILQDLNNLFSAAVDVNALGQQVDRVEHNVWSNAISMGTWAYSAFGDTFNFASGLLDGLKTFLGHLFKDLIFGHIKALLSAIWNQLTDKHSWLRRMIATLQAIQKLQKQYQLQTLKRVIGIIQRVRTVLKVFRLFHLKFATKLDNWLGGIEGKLIHGTFDIAKKTNEILGWVNVFTDPTGFLSGKWTLSSIARDMSAIAAAARALDLKAVFPRLLDQHETNVPASPRGPVKQLGV